MTDRCNAIKKKKREENIFYRFTNFYSRTRTHLFRNNRRRTCRWWQSGSFSRVLNSRPSLTIRPTSRRSFSRLPRMFLISALARASAARSSSLNDRRRDTTVSIKSCSLEQCLKKKKKKNTLEIWENGSEGLVIKWKFKVSDLNF